MTDKSSRPYLRLATSQNAPVLKQDVQRRKPTQLSFDYPEPHSVVLVDVARIRDSTFVAMLKALGPKWVIDVRAVPRLDILLSSRQHAFAVFENLGAVYIDLFGRLKIGSYRTAEANPAFWSPELVRLLSTNTKLSGPFLFLFDDPALMEVAEQIFPNALRPAIGDKITVTRVSTGTDG